MREKLYSAGGSHRYLKSASRQTQFGAITTRNFVKQGLTIVSSPTHQSQLQHLENISSRVSDIFTKVTIEEEEIVPKQNVLYC